MQQQDTLQATNLLAEARDAAARGDRARAHELAIQATGRAPRDIEALLFRAAVTDDLKETLECLSQVISLRPDHPDAQRGMYETLQHLLEQNAFLAYLDETNRVYHVRTGTGEPVTVPKLRESTAPYPHPQPALLRSASRYFTLALLGLPAAGLLTVLSAPLAIGFAVGAQRSARIPADRVRARAILILGLLAWLASLVLAALFIVHLGS